MGGGGCFLNRQDILLGDWPWAMMPSTGGSLDNCF